jgi:hypothetical protein
MSADEPQATQVKMHLLCGLHGIEHPCRRCADDERNRWAETIALAVGGFGACVWILKQLVWP